MPDEAVGQRLRELAHAKHLSISGLARLVGLPQRTIHNYVQGTQPPERVFAQIAEKTGCSLEWLATGSGPMFLDHEQAGVSHSGDGTLKPRLVAVTQLPADAPGLYEELRHLPDHELGDVLRRLMRVYLGSDDRVRMRVAGFLEGLDPGEKKAGLAGDDGRTRMARHSGRTARLEDD